MARLSTLSRSIAGRVAVVTGAGSGMGRATAQLFADEGATVAAIDRTADGLALTVSSIEGAGAGAAAGWCVDLSHRAEIIAAVDEIAARFGRIDILVNNAGVSIPAPIASDDYESAWAATMAVNVTAYALMVRAVLPHLRKSDAPRIVNIASTEGLGATASISPYTASKHAVIGLTRALAVELGPIGITVNCVCPGPINTAMTAPIPDEDKALYARRRVPLRRYGEPEEVAHTTLSLVLPAASYVNAAVVAVDGGMTAKNS